jgi:catechol 2,3-dioxygenase-like lactoylglutathione lyase family enzyme
MTGRDRGRSMTLIDHIGFEVGDLARSAPFYDAVLFAVGARRMLESPHAIAYGLTGPELWLTSRGGGPAPPYGHVAVHARGRVAVDEAHAAGLRAGGRDDGAPGPRPRYGERCYAAYLRDPEGLRVEIVTRG